MSIYNVNHIPWCMACFGATWAILTTMSESCSLCTETMLAYTPHNSSLKSWPFLMLWLGSTWECKCCWRTFNLHRTKTSSRLESSCFSVGLLTTWQDVNQLTKGLEGIIKRMAQSENKPFRHLQNAYLLIEKFSPTLSLCKAPQKPPPRSNSSLQWSVGGNCSSEKGSSWQTQTFSLTEKAKTTL